MSCVPVSLEVWFLSIGRQHYHYIRNYADDFQGKRLHHFGKGENFVNVKF